jgi:hypothetical protein
MINPPAPDKSAPVPAPKTERNEVPVPLGKGSDPDYLKDPNARNTAPAPAEVPKGPPKEGAHWPASGEAPEPDAVKTKAEVKDPQPISKKP